MRRVQVGMMDLGIGRLERDILDEGSLLLHGSRLIPAVFLFYKFAVDLLLAILLDFLVVFEVVDLVVLFEVVHFVVSAVGSLLVFCSDHGYA